jgi:hypothetical protein
MASWLAKREGQGWSWAELSRRSGHPTWKLRYWCKRLARPPVAQSTGKRGFVAVAVTDPTHNVGNSIEITTPSGYRVQVARDFDAEHLRRVVEALERGC